MALYIHFPWCIKKCPYCDFNSHEAPKALPAEAYIEALIEDFERDYEYADQPLIRSVFLGGGTPSLFSAEEMQPLFDRILPYCHAQSEITLEANPGTLERGQFLAYRDLGINRISLGVQSFNDVHLKALGRIHDSKSVFQAVDELKRAGFDNFNLDIMHGLPNQTPAEALSDLNQAIACEPTHISWYQLTIEPHTYFAKHPPILPKEEALLAIEEQGFARLAEAGYARYEVSAFAKSPRYYSRHNLNYWTFGDYLGIGAGAHGKISHHRPNSLVRTVKPKVPKNYIQAVKEVSHSALRFERSIPRDEIVGEYMMNALRLLEGFTLDHFRVVTGLPLSTISAKVLHLLRKGLLCKEAARKARIQPTPLGQRFLNEILLEFT